jgi:hypothetical protein
MVQTIFAPKEVFLDFRRKDLFYSSTNRPLEIDVFIPSLNLGLEYQGIQHYKHHYLWGSPQAQSQRYGD